ncbi:hypothetical protein D3C85_1091830 [compost metagenome]
MPLASLNKPNHIIVVKMVGELLHNPLKLIGFKIQVCVEDHGSYFTSQYLHLLCPRYSSVHYIMNQAQVSWIMLRYKST